MLTATFIHSFIYVFFSLIIEELTVLVKFCFKQENAFRDTSKMLENAYGKDYETCTYIYNHKR